MTNFIHPSFKLNNNSYTKQELLDYANTLIQSDQAYLVDFANLILQWFNSDDYIELTTSGTTGPPKKIQLRKEAMINSARATGEFFNIQQGSKALLCMSTKFVGGKLMLIRALQLGWELDVVEPCATPLQGNNKFYDFVAMVPMQVSKSIEELRNVGTLIIGGAKVNTALKEKLTTLPTKCFETYGMTETITHIAAKSIKDECFSVLPHASCSIDERGCLIIDAPSVTDILIITNDVVDLLDNKHFIWKGRVDNVINSGGVKLHPEQIEEKLAKKIPYRFFVASKEDEYFGNKLILVIEHKEYDLPKDIFNELGKYEIPKEIQFKERFIETASGKIIRSKNII
ncbi:AMP-binding protein [Myroides injenensis]|uniref:AMP-binding protein n=1 Tax=Myroides injenensis TaxID=1183151 RepID=UPI0002897EC5|nr:AMP-binding protein [Myroides injenensis]